MKYKLGL